MPTDPNCDFVKVAAQTYLEGAKDLKSFTAKMRQKFGVEIDEDVIKAAFEKGVEKYQRNLAPLDSIKADIFKALSDARRDGFWRFVGSARKAGLLTGIRTMGRNILGNTASTAFEEVARLPGGVADMVMSAVTGQRTTAVFDPKGMVDGITSAVTDGMKKSWSIIKTGATPDELAKYDIPKELNWYIGKTRVPLLNEYVNLVGRIQGAYDRPAREYAFKRSLVEQAQLIARAEKAGKARIEELVKNPTEEMTRQAIADAEQAVFANSNVLSDAANRLKASSEGARFALDMAVPFVRTPTNIGLRALESTPLGIARAGRNFLKLRDLVKAGQPTREMQRQIAREFGRGATGTALMGLGAWLYKEGVVSPSYSPTKSVTDRQEATGVTPGAAKIGDTWHRLGDSPAGVLIIMGATIAQGQEKSGATGASLGAAKAFTGTMLDMPMMKSAKDVTETGQSVMREEEGLPSAASRLGAQAAGSFVPTAVADVQAFGDRNVRRGTGLMDVAKQRAQGADSGLPVVYDALGRPVQRPGLLNPTEGRTQRTGAVEKELERLKVGLTKAQRVSDDKKPYWDRNDAEYQERVKFTGEKVRAALERLVAKEAFQRLPDEKKKEVLEDWIRRAKAAASKELNGRRQLKRKPKAPSNPGSE